MVFIESESSHLEYISLPRRGLRIVAPPELQDVLASINQRRKDHIPLSQDDRKRLWTPEQKARLDLLLKCKITARRFPTPEHGKGFMQEIDMQRRDEYMTYVRELTENIVNGWSEINSQKAIAVILFGSVAKGLVKDKNHSDPSNIDMTIIGDFSGNERCELFDKIRSKREEISERIRSSSPNIDYSIRPLPGNVGVCIQNTETLSKDRFGETRVYLSAGAFATYDPSDIWTSLTEGAINVQHRKITPTRSKQPQIVFAGA